MSLPRPVMLLSGGHALFDSGNAVVGFPSAEAGTACQLALVPVPPNVPAGGLRCCTVSQTHTSVAGISLDGALGVVRANVVTRAVDYYQPSLGLPPVAHIVAFAEHALLVVTEAGNVMLVMLSSLEVCHVAVVDAEKIADVSGTFDGTDSSRAVLFGAATSITLTHIGIVPLAAHRPTTGPIALDPRASASADACVDADGSFCAIMTGAIGLCHAEGDMADSTVTAAAREVSSVYRHTASGVDQFVGMVVSAALQRVYVVTTAGRARRIDPVTCTIDDLHLIDAAHAPMWKWVSIQRHAAGGIVMAGHPVLDGQAGSNRIVHIADA